MTIPGLPDIAEQYDALAEDYEAGRSAYLRRYPDGALDAILRRLGTLPAGTRALDAGCGTGRVAAALRGAGAEACGLDASERMLALGRENFPEGIRFVAGRIEAMPFADGAFDVVASRYALHHAPDLPAAYRELARVLRPGGRLVAAVIHPLWEYLLRPLPRAYGQRGIGAIRIWPEGPPVAVPMRTFADFFPAEAFAHFELLGTEESVSIPPAPGSMESAPTFLLLDWRKR